MLSCPSKALPLQSRQAQSYLYQHYNIFNDETVKTEPGEFEDGDKKPLEDKVEGGRFNACDVEKIKPEPEAYKP